jgi:uncharacterized membrane protein
MAVTYRSRLRQDLTRWEERGLITPALRGKLEADALSASAFPHLQSVLVLCGMILASVSLIAFVAANWAAILPLHRMAMLLAANAVAVGLTYVAFERRRRIPGSGGGLWLDAAAVLSIVAASASVALVAQTFHLPTDPRGYAVTVAAIAILTALVTRSGAGVMIAAVALTAAVALDVPKGLLNAPALFWPLLIAAFVACLSGWVAARASTFLLLLIPMATQLGAVAWRPPVLSVRQDVVLLVAAILITLGHGLVHLVPAAMARQVRGNLGLAARASGGLVLFGIALATVATMSGQWMAATPWAYAGLASAVAGGAALLILLPLRRVAVPVGDVVILGAGAMSLLGPLLWPYAGTAGLAMAPFWTVWAGLVPCLAVAIAAHLDDRRTLFGWSMAVCAGLIVMMLYVSRDLLGFSANLLVSAAVIGIAVIACRWAEARVQWRLS